MKQTEFILRNANECMKFGENFSKNIRKGDIIGLVGDLASGKTTFVKGIMKGLNFNYTVSSPTFTLINLYNAKYDVNHVDFYREPNIDRWIEIGFKEMVFKSEVIIVEWADLIPELLPSDTKFIKFEHYENNFRKITLL